MYNNIYNAGFYPQTGMAQGFYNNYAVNQVPPKPEHEGHEGGGIKLTTALEGLAAVGGAVLLYKVTKGKLHNVKTPAKQAAKQGAETAEQVATQEGAATARQKAGANSTKPGLWTRINDSIEKDLYTAEELKEVQAQRAAGKGPERPMTTVIKMPYYGVKTVVMAPINVTKGVINFFKKAPKVETEALQHTHAPQSAKEHAAEEIRPANADVTSIPPDAADISTEAMPIHQSEAQQ